MKSARHSHLFLAACAAAFCAQAAWSADPRVVEKVPEGKIVEVKAGSGGNPAAAQAGVGSWLEKLQGHMKKMEAIAARYEQSIDAVERQKLWAEHQKEMWAGLQLVHQQAGGMMQSGCTNPPPGMVKTLVVGGNDGARAANADARFERLERRLDAMQTMMNRVIVEGLGIELPEDEPGR